jgi:hypothetical protein
MFKVFIIMKSHFRAIISVILAIILFISYPLPVIAEENTSPITSIIEIFTSAWKGGRQRTNKDVKQVTGSPRGGAKRGRCQEFISLGTDEIPLTAFAFSAPEAESSPSKSDTINVSKPASVWGQTIEQYPTFLFYIPYGFKNFEIENGKFVLLDKNQKMIGKPVRFKLPEDTTNRPVLGKLTLPKTLGPLEDGEEYNWYFSIICNQQKPSRNPSVSGWIEKLESSVYPPTYLYYFDKGIWYDAIARLIESQDSQPLSQKTEWLELIKFIIGNVEEKPQELDRVIKEIAQLKIYELKIADEKQS